MAFKGMNPDEGREVATEIRTTADAIGEAIEAATGIVNSVDWVGPDYDSYQSDWNAFVSGVVSGLIEAMNAKADELNNHAEEQDTTSNQS